jgi:hypothetical protein
VTLNLCVRFILTVTRSCTQLLLGGRTPRESEICFLFHCSCALGESQKDGWPVPR